VGLFILLALGGIATWLFLAQSRFDPTIIAPVAVIERPAHPSASGDPQNELLQIALHEEMRPLSPLESFGSETLSEKINGKAELYLSAGFVHLRCQRFARINEPSSPTARISSASGRPRLRTT
jgi:hypothetical protein